MSSVDPNPLDHASVAAGLQPLTAALLECVTPEDVAEVIAERGISVLGAEAAIVAVLSESGKELEILALRGYAPSVGVKWRTFPVDASYPLSRTVRDGRPQFVSTGAEWRALYPNLVESRTRDTKATVDLPLMDGRAAFGGLHFSFPDEREFQPSDRAVLLELSRQCALSMSRARLRAKAERAHHRMEFLARATNVLVSSLDYEHTLDNIARLAVPEFADCVQVYIASAEDGTLQRLGVAHRDPDFEATIRAIQERYPIDPSSTHPVIRAVATGQPQMTAAVTDEMIVASVSDPEYLKLLLPIGIRSVLTAPLVARGVALGAIVFIMTKDSERHFDSSDVSFLTDLAGRAAFAVDNARLYADAQREVEARRVRDERLSLAIEGGDLGTWHLDLTTNELTWSDKCKALFGLGSNHETHESDILRLHIDDLPRVQDAVHKAIEGGEVYDVQYRAVWPDSSMHWIRSRGRAFYDGSGRPIRFEGVMMDIDERVQAEMRRGAFLRDVLFNATDGKLNLFENRDMLPICRDPVGGAIELSDRTLFTLRRRIRESAALIAFPSDRLADMLTAADEAAMNAVVHAGSGIAYVCSPSAGQPPALTVRIEDSGSGIAMDQLPNATLLKGYTTAGTMGFGFKLIVQAVDRVSLATGRDGTTVVLEQYPSPPAPMWLASNPGLA